MSASAVEQACRLPAHMPDSIAVEHVFDMHVEVAPVQAIASPGGTRMIYVAQGGTVLGDRIRGEVVPGGGDWSLVGTDRVVRLDVRASIRTDDNELILCTATGRIVLGDESITRFLAGGDVAYDDGYLRSAPLFETGAESYRWLTECATVAVNAVGPGYVDYRVFRVL